MSQRAALVIEKGTPAVVQERPIPTSGDSQVLVKLAAAGVNAINARQRDVGLFITSWPVILGSDGSGYVEKVGKNVTRFAVGDLIFYGAEMYSGIDTKVFQEYALADELVAVKVPPSITALEAATFPTSVSTAGVGLFHTTGANLALPSDGPTVPSDSSIVILGGSGGIGQAAIQLARIAGFGTIITTSSKAHAPFVSSLGATHILDRSASAKEILDIAPGVKLVFDTISQENTRTLALNILTENGGTVLSTLPYQGVDVPKNITAKFLFGTTRDKPELALPLWRAVEKWLAEGELKPNKTLVFEGLEKVDEAISKVKEGVSGEKIVVKIS